MAEVTKEQAGVYRQVAHRLRIQGAPGKPDRISERPRHKASRRFLDSDEDPTLVKLREGDPVDVDFLLGIGAIEPHQPRKASKKGAASGKDPGQHD